MKVFYSYKTNTFCFPRPIICIHERKVSYTTFLNKEGLGVLGVSHDRSALVHGRVGLFEVVHVVVDAVDDGDVLDPHDVSSVAGPVEGRVAEHVDEPDEGHDVRDSGRGRVGDGALDRGEDCTSGDAHDQDAGTATGVSSEVGGSEGEDGRVHGRLEEEDGHEGADSAWSLGGEDDAVDDDGDDDIDGEEEVRLEDGGECRGEEPSDGEDDEGVGEVLRSSRVGEARVLDGVVDEEGGDRDLGTDITELGEEGKEHVVLLVEWADVRQVGRGLVKDRLAHLREPGAEEQDSDGGTGAGDREVDVLDVGQVVLVASGEEELGGDEGSDETGDTVPRLTELESGRGRGWVTDDDGVRVGGSLEGGETTGDDQSTGEEPTVRGEPVVEAGEVSSRPEEDRAEGVEAQSHDDGELVSLSLEDLCGDWREEEVSTAKVHDLETGGLQPADLQDILEVLVEHIEQTVGETPEEEEGDDQGQRPDELPAPKEICVVVDTDWTCTSCHCVELVECL